MAFLRFACLTASLFLLPAIMVGQTSRSRPDVWEPLKFFIGKWEGTGKGQPGTSKVQREYRLVLNEKFLHVQNRSVYDPQPNNPKGEIHQDWGMISFDKSRRQFVFRQFPVEGLLINM